MIAGATAIDGHYVVFYARRRVNSAVAVSTRPRSVRPQTQIIGAQPSVNAELVEGLRALGMEIDPAQVDAALAACYPAGRNGTEQGEVLRELWRYLRRSNSAR